MKKFILISVFAGLHVVAFAQTPTDEFVNRMNYVFANVNRGNVSTGLLSNYGAQSIPLEYYNGVPTDSNFVDIDSYKLLYAGLYSSKFNSNITLITPDEFSTHMQSYTSGAAIPVSIMHYAYNRIKETAVEQGLVNVMNEQIIEIAGKNPYETFNLFAAGPKEVITEEGAVSFIFPSTLRMTNITKTVQNLQVRFDENLTYVTTGWNTVVSYNYTTQGVKKVRFKINYTDGTSFISQTNIVVTIPQTGGGTRAAGPGDAIGIGGAQYDIPIDANSLHSGGTIQVKLATSNSTGKIKKALVIAEGFDVSPKLNQKNTDLHSLLSDTIRTRNIIFDMDNNGYDIVYVDNKDGTDDIKRNAELFIHALSIINSSAYKNANASQNIVMGISMGGLVARYALRKMETHGKDHKTWKYISIDSPHKGANVPVGFQGVVRHFSSLDFKFFFRTIFKMTDIPMVNDALLVLNSPAAKQMLIYNVNDAGTGYDNSIHTAFLTEYEQMGFPQKCQNIAVSNGNSNGTALFAPGSSLLDVNYKYTLTFMQEYVNILLSLHPFTTFYVNGAIIGSNYPQLLLNIIPGKTQFGANVVVNAIGTAPNSTVYSGSIKFHKKILWLINSSVTLTSSTLKAQAGMVPIDGATGGIIDFGNYMDKIPNDFRPYIKQTKFSFIPRGSSLALNDWNINFTANLQGVDLFSSGKTEFEYVSMSPTIAEQHVTFDASKQFVLNQLTDKPVSPNTFQSVFCGNQHVTLSNPQSIPLTWSVSDNMFGINSPTNTSAIINSAPMPRSAILNVGSTNSYPLRKRLISTCSFSISGPSTVCDQATYTINNLPEGAAVQWSVSNNNLILLSQQGNEATFKKNGNGASTINSRIISGANTINLTPLQVWAGTPVINEITGQQHFPNGGTGVYTADVRSGADVNLHWSVYPSLPIWFSGLNAYVTFPSTNGDYQITLTAANNCGDVKKHHYVATGEYEPFKIYPNPAATTVTIQLDADDDTTAGNQTFFDQGVNKSLASGDVEIQLWSAASLLKTYKTDQTTYEFSVSDLPKGIYFVRVIKDGRTYTQKLIRN